MADIKADRGIEFARSTLHANTRIRYDDDIELTSRNGFSNPDLRDFDAEGSPENVILGAPDDPVGWGVLIRKAGNPDNQLTEQTLDPLPMSRDRYYQDEPLIEGAPPPDATNNALIAPPEAARARVKDRARTGLRGGVRGIAYGWIIAPRRGKGGGAHASPYLTEPSPRVYVTLATGEGAEVPLPQDAPEGAIGIYIASTGRQDNETQAATATLWIQRRRNIEHGIPPTERVVGPFRREERAPSTNKTYQGKAGKWPAPVHDYRRATAKMHAFSTKLSYRYLTEFGWSQPQDETDTINTTRYKDRRVGLYWHPRKMPRNAKMWEPSFLGRDGLWYALPAHFPGRPAWIVSNDPQRFGRDVAPQQVERNRAMVEDDATGLPGPDTPLETPVVILSASLSLGKHTVKTVFYDRKGRRSAPSDHAVVEITSPGQVIEVKRPRIGNLIPDPTMSEIDPVTGQPAEWEFPATTAQVDLSEKGRIKVTDTFATLTDEQIARTPWADFPRSEKNSQKRYSARLLVDMTSYVSGRLRVSVRSRDTEGGPETDQEYTQSINAAGLTAVRFTVGVVGSGADVEIAAGRESARLLVRAVGSSIDGARNYTAIIKSFGLIDGWGIPRTYPEGEEAGEPDEVAPPETEETPEEPYVYPRHGSARIVRNVPDAERHPDLAGIDLNAFEYWAPFATPASDDYGIRGYRTPVNASTQYTISAYVEYRGISAPTSMIYPVVKDAKGRTLQELGPILSGVFASSAPARHTLTFTTDPEAAYVEIARGGFSDGFVRVMGFQLDTGAVATAYTNANALSGYWTMTFDTGAPGVEDAPRLQFLGEVAEWLEAGAIYTDDSDLPIPGPTSVGVTMRTTDVDSRYAQEADYSPWYSSLDDVPKLRYWQVRVDLATTDPLESPRVSWIGVSVAYKRAMLLRPDGTMYPGCVQATGVPVPVPTRKRSMFISDNNTPRPSIRGRRLWRIDGFGLEGYFDETVERVSLDAGDGDGLHIIEDYDANRRYVAWMEKEPAFEVDREVRPVDGSYWLHRASGLSAYILARERLVGGPLDEDD